MAYRRKIIDSRYIYHGEYKPPALMYSYRESKIPAQYETSTRKVTDEEIQQIHHIVEGVNTTERVGKPPLEPQNPYHYDGDNINNLLTQLVYSVYKNSGIPSSYINKIVCNFGDCVEMNIYIFQNDNGTHEIEFYRRFGDRNKYWELKTKILCDVNTNYFNHLYL